MSPYLRAIGAALGSAALLALLSISAACLAVLVLHGLGAGSIAEKTPGWSSFDELGIVLLAPLVETGMLAGAIHVVEKITSRRRYAIVAAAISMAALHGLVHWTWAIIQVLPFLIFSVPFACGKMNRQCCLQSFVIHAMHNLYAGVILLAWQA